MEPDELLHLIDELEDERSRARRREGIWVSVLAHIVLFWFLLYGIKFLPHRPRVVPMGEENPKDMTVLTVPSDVLKQVQPRVQMPRPAPGRNTPQPPQQIPHVAQQHSPAPALPKPVPQQAPPQQQAQVQPPQTPPVQPPPMRTQPQSQSQVETPKAAPTKPSFNTGTQSAGEAIQQALRDAARHPNAGGGEYGAAPTQQSPMNAGADILSDTMGVDFNPYMQRVVADTYRAWIPIIPESARPPLNKQGKVGIRFRIYPDGSVKMEGGSLGLEFPSSDTALDRAAWGAITGAAPYPPLPKAFKGPYLELRFGFYYNLDPYKSR
jgi:outer membrane biosynthesis protein TonB